MKIDQLKQLAASKNRAIETETNDSFVYRAGTHNVYQSSAPQAFTSVVIVDASGNRDYCSSISEAHDVLSRVSN